MVAKEQRRGRRIAMTEPERDEFLTTERMCRVATVNGDGTPHVSPLWFVWDGTALWLNSVVKSQRWVNLTRDGRVAVVVDGGHDFADLRGVELHGSVEVVGEVPQPRGGPLDEQLAVPQQLFGEKYANGKFQDDGAHAWLRLVPDRIVSWDFGKMAALAAARKAAG